MTNDELREAYESVSKPLVADACLRLGIEFSSAPTGIRSVVPDARVAGRARPVRHFGSVDIFLEAIDDSDAGDILVIDNGGRPDEGCIGDLVVLEAQAAGLSGVVVWGCHRDTGELVEIGMPVFSYASCPAGPRRLSPRDDRALGPILFGSAEISRDTAVFADPDGVLFVPLPSGAVVLATAAKIRDVERRQAEQVAAGRSLRSQLRFGDYLARRATDPTVSFREHLRRIGGAIEE